MGKQIFKLQRPLFSTEAEPKILVYNKSRSIHVQMVPTPEITALFDGDPKIYVLARLRKGVLEITRRVKSIDQNW